jgi:hypothetical protein
MRPPRLTVRTLMIAVAFVALLLGGGLGYERHRRRQYFLGRVAHYQANASEMRSDAADFDRKANAAPDAQMASMFREIGDVLRGEAAINDDLARRARDFASRTWPPPVGSITSEQK